MRKCFKLFLTCLLLLVTSINVFAQDEVEYKDVILDGKPAKLNVTTGEITLVNVESKKNAKAPLIVEESKSELISDENITDFHIVKEGETLLDVSRQYKVSLMELKRVNNLETTLINKGQTLRVKNFDAQIASVPLGEASNTSKKNNSNFHIVASGETLYSLSRQYNLSLNELKSKNNLNTNLIKVGQKLRVSSFGISNEVDNISIWTVLKGDTIFSISRKSGTSVEAIKQLNGLTNNTIIIGQILQLK